MFSQEEHGDTLEQHRLLGIVLAFLGKLIWKPLMSIIGAFIGATLGFIVGMLLAGEIGGLVLMFIGGIIGGKLFSMIVEFALAVIAAIVTFGLLTLFTGSYIVAAIGGIVVLVLCIVFRKKVVGLVMAVVGSVIAGVALMSLSIPAELAAVVALVMMIAGGIVQTFFVKTKEEIAESRKCPSCGGHMVQDKTNGLWYCPNCRFGGMPPNY